MRTKKETQVLLGKRIVDVTFRRFTTTSGTKVAEPTLHLSDGSRLIFHAHELEDDYAVSMFRIEGSGTKNP